MKLLYGSGLRLMECLRLRVEPLLGVPRETWILPDDGFWSAVLNRGGLAPGSPLDERLDVSHIQEGIERPIKAPRCTSA